MDGLVELENGRCISYREYGDAEGVPVIFYHGACNSRLFEPVSSLALDRESNLYK
eukprot:SAG31_NODE_2056_length_6546_cov_1.979060_3_plen_55_part_00